MKAILRIGTLAVLSGFAAAAVALGPPVKSRHGIPPREQNFYYHYEWTHGAVLTSPEWKRGTVIQHPRRHGLPQAPKGQEWREIDRNYVLASSSTHAIERVMAAPHPTVSGRSGGEP